ncbi:MAG: aspartate kinase [Bacillota bacterium]|jgi:aspartate kinase
MIIVQKFGGSSVADAEKMKKVAGRIFETAAAGNKVVVVVSAMGDTTDHLISLANQLIDKPPRREMDMLLSTGEQQSIALLSMALISMGCQAVSLTGPQAGFHTDGVFAKAKINSIDCQRVHRELDAGKVVVVAGFQGVDNIGDINTLGRGGSDTSAVALAVALDADICEVFTDVDGVYTADPRVVPRAQKMAEVSYDEMLEMAAMGAGILQPRSVEVAKEYKIKLHVRSSFNHEKGTIVQEETSMNKGLEKELMVSGVAHDTNVLKVTIFDVPDRPGVAGSIFSALAKEKINVDMIIQSGRKNSLQDMSFTTVRDDKSKVLEILDQVVENIDGAHYSINDQVAKISIIGAGMITNPGVAAKMFEVLAENNFNIQMISTSEIKVSCIIDEERIRDAAVLLHTAFDLDQAAPC